MIIRTVVAGILAGGMGLFMGRGIESFDWPLWASTPTALLLSLILGCAVGQFFSRVQK